MEDVKESQRGICLVILQIKYFKKFVNFANHANLVSRDALVVDINSNAIL